MALESRGHDAANQIDKSDTPRTNSRAHLHLMLWEPQPRTTLFLAGVGALQTDACRLSQQILAVGHILSSLILHCVYKRKVHLSSEAVHALYSLNQLAQ